MFKTTVALTNNVVGNAILVLPILFLQNGLIVSILVIVINGFYNYWSCQITLDHMSQKEDYYADTIERHYRRQVFPIYQICCFISNELFFYMYFNLMIKQWDGLLYKHKQLLPYVPYFAFVTLILITLILRGHSSGVTLMALGILSTVFYVFFLIWLAFDKPFDSKPQFPMWKGDKFLNLANLMGTAFSTQTMLIQILRISPQGNNLRTVIYTFTISTFIYIFVGWVGGIGIIDIKCLYTDPQTINQYFHSDGWQLVLLQVLYIIHIYSVWPQWTYINCDRLFKLLKTQHTRSKQIIYTILCATVACTLYLTKVNIYTIVDLNGGICQYLLAYIIPIYIHVHCRYLNQIRPMYVKQEGDDAGEMTTVKKYLEEEHIELNERCEHERETMDKVSKIVDITILITMMIYGGCIMSLTVWETILKHMFK